MEEKLLEYRQRAVKAEKELAKVQVEFRVIIEQLKSRNAWLTTKLVESQSKCRIKDWTIRQREEEIDALRRKLRAEH